MPAATLRPETMYGQTNAWVLPGGEYGVYQMNDDDELFVCSERSAMNMSWQGMMPVEGAPTKVATVKGSELLVERLFLLVTFILCPLHSAHANLTINMQCYTLNQ
jgi:leucyl-tRNA synthetase